MPAISSTSQSIGFGPTVDFVELTESPEMSARAGRLNNLSSAIIGTTLDEGRFLMPIMMPVDNGPRATAADLHRWLQTYYPGAADNISRQYNLSGGATGLSDGLSPWETAAVIYTDSQYLCPTQRSARWLSGIGAKTFVYRLEYQPSIFAAVGQLVYQTSWCADFSRCAISTLADPGVGHSADVFLLFNDPRMNATDFVVANTMIDYWLNFASSGNPSVGDGEAAEWPTFLPDNVTLQLRQSTKSAENLRRTQCDFWEHIAAGIVPPPTERQPTTITGPRRG